MIIVGTIVIVAAAIAIGLVLDRRLRPRPQELQKSVRIPSHGVGEAPATAIRAGATQLAKLRASQRCRACRASVTHDGEDDHVRYADRELIVLHFRCPDCGAKRVLYVVPVA